MISLFLSLAYIFIALRIFKAVYMYYLIFLSM